MGHEVYADTMEIAGKAGMNKSIARFPDVCLSPPSPPAGPVPVPYPDTSFSSDLKEGSQTVMLGGEPAALAQQSYYQPSALGDEAATRSFGANVVTHQITGKTFFQAWSMDVKFEGKNVCRHVDITTSNHGSSPPGTPPAPSAETQTLPDAQKAVDEGKCPCCGKALHEWQKDDKGNAFKPMKENDFWQNKINQVKDPKKQATFQKIFDDMKAKKAGSRADAAAGRPSCPNVHNDEEKGCAIYFDVPKGARSVYTSPRTGPRTEPTGKSAKLNFEDRDKDAAVAAWELANPGETYKGITMNHKTPSMASGCNNPYNVVPDTAMQEADCQMIEAWQTKLEQINNFV
jgi:Domain of unknown function (DUF4150)